MSVPPSNVKVYDRPEKKAPSPLVIVVVLLVCFFIYKAMHHDTPVPAANARPGIFLMPVAVQREPAFRLPSASAVFTL